MKIAFHSNQLCERGTEIALYDYAFFNEKLLGNKSIVISNKNNDLFSFDKFKKHFEVYLYNNISELDGILIKQKVDIFYAIKSGEYDHVDTKVCKTVIHCVFSLKEPHGDVYAAISLWLIKRFGVNVPVVPHMIYLPENSMDFRKELGIPQDAVVFGRYGGMDTFNIKFVHKTISRIVNNNKNIYFLFMNTFPFYRYWFSKKHKQIIHLPGTSDMNYKVAFINTCDAMIHARTQGETFGLAIGEFSIKNKPVFTYKFSKDNAHQDILMDKAIVYENSDDLYDLITNFDKNKIVAINLDAYSEEYNPARVMEIFKKVFIE